METIRKVRHVAVEAFYSFLLAVFFAIVAGLWVLTVAAHSAHAEDAPAFNGDECEALGGVAADVARRRLDGLTVNQYISKISAAFDRRVAQHDEMGKPLPPNFEHWYDAIVQVARWVYRQKEVVPNPGEVAIKNEAGDITGYLTEQVNGEFPSTAEYSPDYWERAFDIACKASHGRPPMLGRKL